MWRWRPSILLFIKVFVWIVSGLVLFGCQSAPPSELCGQPTTRLETELTDVDYDRLDDAPFSNRLREAMVLSYFEICPQRRTQPLPGRRTSNIICRVDGTSDRTIVVGAHFDKLGPGKGIADNWSGIVLMIRLLGQVTSQSNQLSWEFIAFADEEQGMLGSRHYVSTTNLKHVVAMLNVDTMGMAVNRIDKRSDPNLRCEAYAVANSANIQLRDVLLRETTGDWAPFQMAGIPVLNLMSLDKYQLRKVHSRDDRRRAVKDHWLNESWQLLANLQRHLDEKLHQTD